MQSNHPPGVTPEDYDPTDGEREESRTRECEACTNEAHPKSEDGYCAKDEMEARIEALREDPFNMKLLDAVVEWRGRMERGE